jgi:hypothetical protein
VRRDAAGTRAGRARASSFVRIVDRLTLAAIGIVVALVSIPRLKAFALRENELDAAQTLRVLGAALGSPGWDFAAAGLVGPPLPRAAGAALAPATVGELFLSTPSVARRLEDAELLADGRLLRRHGYLFDLTFDGGEPVLRAWPWCYGETGLGAFSFSRAIGLVGHPNERPRWYGTERSPALPRPGEGWLSIR